MLDRLCLGVSFESISRSFNVNESTVRSIKKFEDKIRSSIASTSLSTKIVHDPAIEKMEGALSLCIEDCNQGAPKWSNGPIESSDIQDLLESQDEDLTETDLEEILKSQPLEEEASTSTGDVTFNLKILSEH
uniref:HTH psq-type domain-containing protein n=1 Tax=Glossina pallidipes TaxID=7398 RepID=A0A1A9ZNS5_GLOPL